MESHFFPDWELNFFQVGKWRLKEKCEVSLPEPGPRHLPAATGIIGSRDHINSRPTNMSFRQTAPYYQHHRSTSSHAFHLPVILNGACPTNNAGNLYKKLMPIFNYQNVDKDRLISLIISKAFQENWILK